MRLRLALPAAMGVILLAPVMASAAPVLRGAEVRVDFQSSTSCVVEIRVDIEGAAEVEHRVEVARGARIELRDVGGATRANAATDVGRTRALLLRPQAPHYTMRYSVEQPASRAYRCPLWIPAVPADGRAQSVRVTTRIPTGATPVGTMPTFAWAGREGTATIGHLPAFIRVPFVLPGAPAPWDIARVMDVVAVTTLVVATIAWARRRRGQAP